MTDREKAIVMAYTGICMLTGDKFQIFHKYVENIMGRPVYTHEMAIKAVDDEIKEKSKADFMALCADESSSEKPNKWIPVSERLPEIHQDVILSLRSLDIEIGFRAETEPYFYCYGRYIDPENVLAWQPLPEPYKEESEDK